MDREELKKLIKEALLELGFGVGLNQAQPRWLSTQEAVKYSGLSRNTLYRLYQEGEIYATTVGGGKLLWDRESIDEYLLKGKREIQYKTQKILNQVKIYK